MAAIMSGRVPPHNLEAETGILSAMLVDEESAVEAISKISADDFYRPLHRDIMLAAQSVFSAGGVVDLVSVAGELQRSKSEVPLSYLSGLTDVIPRKSLVAGYCDIITEQAQLRRTATLAAKIMEYCYGNEEMRFVADLFADEFFQIVAEKGTGARRAGEVVDEVIRDIAEIEKYGRPRGIETGFADLDRRWCGMAPGDLLIMAARPSMGKTALVMNIACNAALAGHKVLVFSLEMQDKALIRRVITSASRVSDNVIRRGLISEQQWPGITRAAGQIKQMPLWIDHTSGLSITELTARAKMAALRTGVDFVVVDYLQLMQAKAENRTQEISAISRGLKGLAKDLNIPVLALSQLNRGLEGRTNKRPIMSDLRESGAIEQDADIITFIYRDEVYNPSPDNPEAGVAEIITAKQRNGPIGTDRLLFQGEYSSFLNFQREAA